MRAAIQSSCATPALRTLVVALLRAPGRALSRSHPSPWSGFVLHTCGALGGDTAAAVPVAAAVELAVAAADVVDDVVDDEWPTDVGTSRRGVNAALTLAWLAQICLARVDALDSRRTRRVGQLIAEALATAHGGEDLDLLLEASPDVSEATALDVTRAKSGTLVGLACAAGAMAATDDGAVIAAARAFGEEVGVVGQLVNDMAGVDPSDPSRGTDILRRKKTLPVAYALQCAQAEGLPTLAAWYEAPGGTAMTITEEEVVAAIAALGGLEYTWVVAEIHRRAALRRLHRLAARSGRPQLVACLRPLVPNLPGCAPDPPAGRGPSSRNAPLPGSARGPTWDTDRRRCGLRAEPLHEEARSA